MTPVNREKHFIITEVEFDDLGMVISCAIEAVLSRRSDAIDWQALKEPDQRQQGWQ